MTKNHFLAEMDEILDLPTGTLKGPEQLEVLEGWDSTAMIGFIALVDTHNGSRISPQKITSCSTISDLLKLAQVED